jgi:hypothetical protein
MFFRQNAGEKHSLSLQEDQYITTVFRIAFLLKNKYVLCMATKLLKPKAEFMNVRFR